MSCSLFKFTKKIKTHYIGKSGTEYPIDEYMNHGYGGIYRGRKDLPNDDYPYTHKYITKRLFKCCDMCEKNTGKSC